VKKIVCFHGFMGSPDDFDFLKDQFKIDAINIETILSLSINEISEFVKSKRPDFLLGYSFGARLAIQVYCTDPNSYEKLFLLGGHAGLKTETEREKRVLVEQEFLRNINEKTFEKFLVYWNNLDIFKYDKKVNPLPRPKNIMNLYFKNWGLSMQPYCLETLLKYNEKVHWFFGANDMKYRKYAEEFLVSMNVDIIENAGHRLLQQQNEVKSKLMRYLS